MDPRRTPDKNDKLRIFLYNSNGKIINQRLFLDCIDQQKEGKSTIVILNDIRCQNAADIYIEGYSTIIQNDPANGSSAGGVAILFPKGWTSSICDQPMKESVIASLTTNLGEELIVASMYNRPGNYVPKSFIEKLDSLNADNKRKIILAGDFNSAAVALGSRIDTPQGKHLVDIISSSSLGYVENEVPTFYSRSSGSWNILDCFFVSDEIAKSLVDLQVMDACESDHNPVMINLQFSDEKQQKFSERTDWEKFRNEIRNDNQINEIEFDLNNLKNKIANNDHIESITNEINKVVTRIGERLKCNKSNATRRKKLNSKKDFPLKMDTRMAIKERRKLATLIKVNKNIVNLEEIRKNFNKITKKVKQLIKRDKKQHLSAKAEKLINEKDARKKWKGLKEFLGSRNDSNTPLAHLKKKDGTMTQNIKEIVDQHAIRLEETHSPKEMNKKEEKWMNKMINDNETNSFFLRPQIPKKEDGDESVDEAFNMESLVDSIESLKSRAAPGDDDVTNEMLKNLPGRMIRILLETFKLCVNVGHFPDAWKRARIKMLPKPNRCVKDSANYRPISLLSCIGKLFEKLLKKIIDKSNSSNNTIPELHSGFRRKRCTQETFVRLSERIGATRKKKGVTVALALDIDKAFDRLSHHVVRYRLRRLPLPNKLVRTLSSFLRDRTLYVKGGETVSKTVTMRCGSPQGAIVSPDLFILASVDTPAINDEDEGATQFADDITTWASGRSVREAVNLLKRRISKLERWCQKWFLFPSADKSQLVCFTASKKRQKEAREMEVRLMGKTIEWSDNMKILGANFDSGMRWKEHINGLIKAAYPKVVTIARMNRRMGYCDRKIIMDTFNSLIVSSFEYSSLAFMSCSETYWKKLENFYCRSIKQIFDLPRGMNSSVARGLFTNETFKTRLQRRAIERFHDMVNDTKMMTDMVLEYRDYQNKPGRNTLLDTIRKKTELPICYSCSLCSLGLTHSCVGK